MRSNIPEYKCVDAKKKMRVARKLKRKGAFWSYDVKVSPEMNDMIIIHKGLEYLEFEDMHLLFEAYRFDDLKRYWRENMVSQPDYYATLNILLAILFFRVKNPKSYLLRYGKKLS